MLPLIGSTKKKEEKEMKAKRFGSLLLTIVMVASLITALPVSASAAEVQNGTAYSANNITYSGQTRQASTGSFFVDNIGDVDYNGNYQTPKPIVMSLSGIVLRENRDYELSYHNNRNAGIATITITGLGSYENQVQTLSFTINEAPLYVRVNSVQCAINENPDFSYTLTGGQLYGNDTLPEPEYSLYNRSNGTKGITASFAGMDNYDIHVTDGILTYTDVSGDVTISGISDVTYDGTYQTPSPTVTTESGTKLYEGEDYQLSYSNNRNAGRASVQVIGIGRYAGRLNQTVYFNIEKAPLTIQVRDVRCSIHDNPKFSYYIADGKLYGSDSLGQPKYTTHSRTGHSYGPVFDIEVTFPSANTANYDITVREGTLTYTDVDYNTSYVIDVTSSSGGRVSPSGRTLVYSGDNQTFRFYPNSGYEVIAVYVDGKDVGDVSRYTFYDVTENHELYVDFAPISASRYEIEADCSYGGTITPSGTVHVSRDQDRTFVFDPKSGYEVSAVYVDGKKLSYVTEKYTFRDIRDDHTIYVEFERSNGTKFDIDADCSSGGSISPSGIIRVTRGYDRTFTFDPNYGYEVSAIYVDGRKLSYTDDEYTFYNVRDDHTLYVEFERSNATRYEIEADSSSGGTISPSGDVWVSRGSSKTFTFKPNSGYEIEAVYVDGDKVSGTPSSYRFTNVRDDHTIYVEFERTSPNKFEIEADASSGGRISPSGTSTVTRGNNKTYTMTPNSGYGILAVYVDGDYVGDSRTYTFRDVDEDHEIFVRFAKKAEIHDDYDIDITWSDGGSISPSGRGTVSVEKGDDRTFTFVPETGYKVARVYVDDDLVPAARSYTFKDVVEDHTLRVEFEKTGPTLVYPTNWSNPFTDVHAGDWFYDSVKFMNGNGLIQGTSGSTYSPYTTTTRGMIVTILYRLDGAPATYNSNPFYDVSANAYYANAVNWASQAGIVAGYGDGSFHPNDPITRQQMAAILYRYAIYKGYYTANQSNLSAQFSDYNQISSYAVVPMSWAHANGIISGTTPTTLNPTGTATRAQITVMLARFCQRFCM